MAQTDPENPESGFLLEKEKHGTIKFAERHKLILDQSVLHYSLNAAYFAVFTGALCSNILTPNFPFLVSPGTHKDSFKTTAPFGFSAATYFLPLTTFLGQALSSTFIGYLSDKQGRRPWILICTGLGTILSVVKYIVRRSFWGFSVASFMQGLAAAELPVVMAYVSDVKHSRSEKNAAIGYMIGLNMLGATGGGIIAILMPNDLFVPQLLGAVLTGVAFVINVRYLVEPDRLLHLKTATDPVEKEQQDLEDSLAPKSINWRVCVTILMGAVVDNFGSSGLFPICMSPLGFEIFFLQFVQRGETPIMSEAAFKWISTLVVFMLIPSAASSSAIFDKIGAAGGCITGNFFTAIVTMAVFFIAKIEPPTKSTFGGFVAAIYIGFPLTILSQLSTGPMLDMITPVDRRGFMQGLNVTVMNLSRAVSPFILGLLADNVGTNNTIWICVGISFAATVINMPLLFAKELKSPPKLGPDYLRSIKGEDVDFVERALRGEWVPRSILEKIHQERLQKGHHFLAIPFNKFEDDKGKLAEIRHNAEQDFKSYKLSVSQYLNQLDSKEKRIKILEQLTNSRAPIEKRNQIGDEMGAWFKDYIMSAGYFVDDSPFMYKQMIMKAFPPLREEGSELSEENLEQTMLNTGRVLGKYLEEQDVTLHNRAFHKTVMR